MQMKNHSYGCMAQWTAVVHCSNSICAAFTESRMATRHKGDARLTKNSSYYLNFIISTGTVDW